MSAPSSFDRVLAALKRLFPFEATITRPAGAAPAVGDSAIGRELGTIAWMLARAADRVEVFPDELFASTATESIARWEAVFRTASNVALDIDTRRSRVLSVMRRKGGTQPDRLRRMLYAVLDLTDPFDIELIEADRSDIENSLISDSGVVSLNTDLLLGFNTPWPGTVDDTGVRVWITMSIVGGNTTATLKSPTGTTWTFPITQTGEIVYEERTTFLGERAGGQWTLTITDSINAVLTRFKLLVSNNVDSGRIYDFFAYRDPALPGTPDIAEAQRLFNRSALAHMTSYVIQSISAIFDDQTTQYDRDIYGA